MLKQDKWQTLKDPQKSFVFGLETITHAKNTVDVTTKLKRRKCTTVTVHIFLWCKKWAVNQYVLKYQDLLLLLSIVVCLTANDLLNVRAVKL